jgi:hypothetical protein
MATGAKTAEKGPVTREARFTHLETALVFLMGRASHESRNFREPGTRNMDFKGTLLTEVVGYPGEFCSTTVQYRLFRDGVLKVTLNVGAVTHVVQTELCHPSQFMEQLRRFDAPSGKVREICVNVSEAMEREGRGMERLVGILRAEK